MARPDVQPSRYPHALGEGGFEPYVKALRKYPLVVLAVTVAMLLGAGAWLLLRPAQYTATSEILVTPTPYYDPTYLGLSAVVRDTPGDPFRAVETAATMLDAPAAAASTAKRLGSGWTEARVRAAVTVVPMGGTNVLAVRANGAQASTAARLADSYAIAALDDRRRALQSQALQLISLLRETRGVPQARIASLRAVGGGGDPTFSLLHPAGGRSASSAPTVRQVLTIALFAGLILGTAIALVIDRLVGRGSSRAKLAETPIVSSLANLPSEPSTERRRHDDSAHP